MRTESLNVLVTIFCELTVTPFSVQTDILETPPQSVAELVEKAGRIPASTVIIPGGNRVEDLQLVEAARDHGILDRVILVGDAKRIQAAVAQTGIHIDSNDILHADSDEAVAQATVDRIRDNDVDIVLKGNISTPHHQPTHAQSGTASHCDPGFYF